MTERIIIDLAVCDRCEECTAGPAALALRERATFELVCRRCEQASCVLACPFAALERTEDGIIKRHNMRCVSCKSCALACPFGTIYMELLPFYSMDYQSAVGHLVGAGNARDSEGVRQDQEAGSLDKSSEKGRPVGAGSDSSASGSDRGHGPLPQGDLPLTQGDFLVPQCSRNALRFGKPEPTDHIIDEHLAARTRRWNRKEKAA